MIMKLLVLPGLTIKEINILRTIQFKFQGYIFSLTKLMVSRDLPRSTVTKQIAFDQRDLHLTPVFERAMDRHCSALLPNKCFVSS